MNVMDDVQEEDDGYSDDDLDALPADAFHELQENAIRSTQQPNTHGKKHASAFHQPFPRTLVNLGGELGGSISGGFVTQQARAPAHIDPPSSDYGDFDDEMLDGEIYDATEQPAVSVLHSNTVLGRVAGDSTQREEWRQKRYGGPPQSLGDVGEQRAHKALGNVNGHNYIGDIKATYNGHPHDVSGSSQDRDDLESLQAQIQEVRF